MCLYTNYSDLGMLFLLIWVDDIIILSNSEDLLNSFKQTLTNKFKCKDMGQLKYFLGIEFKITPNNVSMNQNMYSNSILERFGMMNSKPSNIPIDPSVYQILKDHKQDKPMQNPTRFRELVGRLIYLMTATRPDLSFAVSLLSQFMSKPSYIHFKLAENTLRYLKHTMNFSLNFIKSSDRLALCGYADADWANAPDCKSISGYCFSLNDNKSMICWKTEKQSTVAHSSCESEYISLSASVSESRWLLKLLKDLNLEEINKDTVNILVDNQSAIALGKNPVHHKHTKHIDIKYHSIREFIDKGIVNVQYVPSSSNLADPFTKPLPASKLKNIYDTTGPKSSNGDI